MRRLYVFLFHKIFILPLNNVLHRSYWIQRSNDINATDTDARADAKYYLASIFTMPSVTHTGAGLATPAQTHGPTQWYKDRAYCRSDGRVKIGPETAYRRPIC